MKRNIVLIVMLCLIMSVATFHIPGNGEEQAPIEISALEVDVEINNAYTITEVAGTLQNSNDDSQDGTFTIQLPNKAFISNFSLTVENKTYYADILPKAEAQEKYNKSVEQGKTAGMAESRDMKQFSFSTNLKAHQTGLVRIRYEHFIEKKLGKRDYDLALKGISENKLPYFNLTLDVHSSREITSLKMPGYENTTSVNWEDSGNAHIEIREENFLPKSDFLMSYEEDSPPVNGTLQCFYKTDEEKYYFFNVFSPQRSELGGSIPKDIIFVLDKSGSMSGEKMSQMKNAFSEIITQLSEEDRFTLISFSTGINVYSEVLLTATENNKSEAKDHINSLESTGSTNIYDGLEDALHKLEDSQERTPIIVLLTDGMPNAGTYSTTPSIRNHIKQENDIFCPIFTLGFGQNVDFEFLSALSIENYAAAKRIYTGSDASEQIQDFYETISTTLLRNISVSYQPNAHFVYPQSIPSLFEGSEIVISGWVPSSDNNLSSHITALSRTGAKEFDASYILENSTTDNEFIRRYWAYSRIYSLLDDITLEGELDNLVSQIENLSLKAHFVTPYTSLYLEVEEGDEAGEGNPAEQENSLRNPTDSNSGSKGGGSLGVPSDDSNEDEGATSWINIPSLVAVFAITVLIRAYGTGRRKR